jgi:hypothetical protein
MHVGTALEVMLPLNQRVGGFAQRGSGRVLILLANSYVLCLVRSALTSVLWQVSTAFRPSVLLIRGCTWDGGCVGTQPPVPRNPEWRVSPLTMVVLPWAERARSCRSGLLERGSRAGRPTAAGSASRSAIGPVRRDLVRDWLPGPTRLVARGWGAEHLSGDPLRHDHPPRV